MTFEISPVENAVQAVRQFFRVESIFDIEEGNALIIQYAGRHPSPYEIITKTSRHLWTSRDGRGTALSLWLGGAEKVWHFGSAVATQEVLIHDIAIDPYLEKVRTIMKLGA